MILLSVVCVLLYVLGGVLAYEIGRLHIETEPAGARSSYRDLGARVAAVLFWPSLAFFLAINRDDP